MFLIHTESAARQRMPIQRTRAAQISDNHLQYLYQKFIGTTLHRFQSFSHLLLCNLTSCEICNLPRKVGRSFVVFSKFPVFRTHPPSLRNFSRTVGPIPHYLRARPEIKTRTRGWYHARHPASNAKSRTLVSFPLSPAFTTHIHALTARTGFAGPIRFHLRLPHT
jgi:hypothetical protein